MSENEQTQAAKGWPELPTRFVLKCELKRGGMGVVFEAFDTVLKSHVAIKVNLRPEPEMRTAFEREAQLLANLRDPSLPRCLDLQTAGSVQFLIMDLIEGDDLSAVMAKRPKALGPLPAETVLEWARQSLHALDYLHSLGVRHRDLKPSNFKVKDGRIYLLDLGLAYGQTEEMNTISRDEYDWGCHSPGYSPPEQFQREQARPASDLYSLAATLYKLLTTHTPPEAEKRVRCVERGEADPLKDISLYNPDLDEHVSLEINRALSLDVKRRPQSAREMERMMFPEPPAPTPVPVVARPRAWRRPLRLLEGFLLVALSVCALLYASGVVTFRSMRIWPEPAEPMRELSQAEQAAEMIDESDHLRLVGQRDEALALVNKALTFNPNKPYAWFVRLALLCDSDEAIKSGAHPPEVLNEARRIVKALPSPSTREEYIALAQAHLALLNFDQAHAAAEKAIGPERDFGPALLISASAVLQREIQKADKEGKKVSMAMVDPGLDDIDAAIEAMPDYPPARVIRAHINKCMHSPVRARRDLMKAIEIAPRAIYSVLLGEVYIDLNDPDAARENFNKALAEAPKLRWAFLALAALGEKHGDWRGAVHHYMEANNVLQTADTFKRLGRAYRQLGEPYLSDAKASYQRVLNFARNDDEALNALEELSEKMDVPEEAEHPIP
jgi:serine/threonine protein kinase